MKLIVGLGNPGEKYARTRHNIGFIIVDEIAKSLGISKFDSKFKGYFAKTSYRGEEFLLLKPQTFMNLSGQSVAQIIAYYKIDIDDILVVYDDLDMETGKIRFKGKSSSGGHNGIKSIESCIGTSDFKRLKFGIDRSENTPVVNYVVGKFTNAELETVIPQVAVAKDACLDFLSLSFIELMNKYN